MMYRWMSMVRMQAFRWSLPLVCCALVLLSLDVNMATRFRLLDQQGQPIQYAFVTYHYSAGTKLIWPWACHEGPFLARTGQDGRLYIPAKVRLRFPFVKLTSPVRLFISAYAPGLHNSCLLFDPAPQDSYCAKLSTDGGESSFRMLDLDAQPPARFRTLWLLIHGFQPLPVARKEQQRELVAAVRAEYDEFLATYGNVVFTNSPGTWGYIKVDDWTSEGGSNRPWSFFLQRVPFYGVTLEDKLLRTEKQLH